MDILNKIDTLLTELNLDAPGKKFDPVISNKAREFYITFAVPGQKYKFEAIKSPTLFGSAFYRVGSIRKISDKYVYSKCYSEIDRILEAFCGGSVSFGRLTDAGRVLFDQKPSAKSNPKSFSRSLEVGADILECLKILVRSRKDVSLIVFHGANGELQKLYEKPQAIRAVEKATGFKLVTDSSIKQHFHSAQSLVFVSPSLKYPKTGEEFGTYAIQKMEPGDFRDDVIRFLPEVIKRCKKERGAF